MFAAILTVCIVCYHLLELMFSSLNCIKLEVPVVLCSLEVCLHCCLDCNFEFSISPHPYSLLPNAVVCKDLQKNTHVFSKLSKLSLVFYSVIVSSTFES